MERDDELREFKKQIGWDEYKKIQMYYCNKSKRILTNNSRASRKKYKNSEEKIKAIKEKYKNGVNDDILKKIVNFM